MATLKVTNIKNESFAGDQLYLKTDGKIGIGTTSPQTLLEVQGSTPILRVTGASTTPARLDLTSAGVVKWSLLSNDVSSALSIEKDDTAKLVIDTSGNVGIGTTSPVAPFHVAHSGTNTAVGTNFISLRSGASGRDIGIQFADGATSAYVGMLGGSIYFADSGSSEKMRIDTNGNVGIGTNSPDGKLSVTGNIVCNSGVVRANDGFVSDTDLILNADANGNGNNSIIFKESNSEHMRINSSGNVGIGTTSPSDHLDVVHSANAAAGISIRNTNNSQGSAFAQLYVSGGDSAKGRVKIETNGAFHTIDEDSNGNLIIEDNGTESLRIDSSGRVLIGTTTEGAGGADELTLNIASGHGGMTIRTANDSNGNIWFSDGTSGADEYAGYLQYAHDGDHMVIGTSGSERMRIDSGGNVGIGTAPDNVGSYHTLHIKGPSGEGAAIRLQDNGDTVDSSDAAIYKNGTALYLRVNGTDPLIAYMNGADRFKVESSGNVTVTDGNLVIGTAGHGINFAATAGAGESETFRDYEEGTWSPGLDTGTATTYLNQWYVKVGAKVTCYFYMYSFSDTTSTDNVTITGLPFTVETNHESAFSIQNTGDASLAANCMGLCGRIGVVEGNTDIAVIKFFNTTNARLRHDELGSSHLLATFSYVTTS